MNILPEVTKRMKIVPGIGPKQAKIAIIGEAPGQTEEIQGVPFVGVAGRFLDTRLSKAGILREEAYISNVVKVRPPQNKIERLQELGVTIQEFYPSLKEELKSLEDLRVIVAVGEVALTAITGLEGIGKWRGSYLKPQPSLELHKDVWVIPVLHPSNIMQYQYEMETVLVHDLIRAKNVSLYGHTPKERILMVGRDLKSVIEFLEEVKGLKRFSWDVETVGDQISCVGFGISECEAMCIPFKNGYRNVWGLEDEELLWTKIGEVLGSKGVKISQNGWMYDNFFCDKFFGAQPAPPHFDTRLAHIYMYGELPHTLQFLTSIYTDIPYYKDDSKDEKEGKRFTVTGEKLWEYNAKDCVATYEVAVKLNEEMVKCGMADFFYGFVAPLYRVLFNIQKIGVPIDKEKLDLLNKQFDSKLETLLREIREEAGWDINPKSSKQIKELIYNKLKLPIQYNKKTKNPTTDEEALTTLYKKTKNQTLKKIIQYRSITTIKDNMLSATPSKDGRMRTMYGATETGRLSSKKLLNGEGMNLQNIPKINGDEDGVSKNIRVIFAARKGYKIIEFDLPQAEAKCVGWLADCRFLKYEFSREGGDVFKSLASEVFKVPFNQVTKQQRNFCKPITHGSHYLMGHRLFAETLGVSIQEGKRLQDIYLVRKAPEIRFWQNSVRVKVLNEKCLVSPLGRKRWFFGRPPYNETSGKETWKEALAQNPQGMVADLNNIALLKMYFFLPKEVEILLQVHDSVVIHCPEDMVDEVIKIAIYCYDKEVVFGEDKLVIYPEIGVGDNWGELIEYKL